RIAREQVLRGVLEKRECFVQTFSAERLTEQLEMTAHETLQRSLEERSQAGRRARSYDRMQPLIAFGEQVAQERYDAIDAIAEMLDQHFELTCDSRILAQPLDEPAPGELVERTRIVGRLERRARACEHRQAARQRGVQRVDRLDAQTRWMLDQTPSVARIRIAYRLRELPGLALVRRCRRRTAGCLHGLQNAASLLRRRLTRERQGQDLFGRVDGREQTQVALREELGLPRARGRLHDERSRRIECPLPGERIATHRSPQPRARARSERSTARQSGRTC